MNLSSAIGVSLARVVGAVHLFVFWSFAGHSLVAVLMVPLILGALLTVPAAATRASTAIAFASIAFGVAIGLVVDELLILFLAVVVPAAGAWLVGSRIDGRATRPVGS